ncbi:FecCD family ABC transporter permease [Agromyces archimandritae]|uniref:Iron ABC transporter permease n=1 Tax=Agromyces archimandritae TaxID=2781962 RepID=A0A975INV0_9MICO|nr:iron ABC transporter permease [Agromyces archimandritae]QTX04940.1 iron ABC transporter permease [Agromyces archimandritae]
MTSTPIATAAAAPDAPPAAPAPPRPLARPGAAAIAIGVGVLAVAASIALAVLSTTVGTTLYSPATVWQAIMAFDPTDDAHLLIVLRRLPRAFLALIVGAALGAAGVLMQSITRNALAEPGLLGVNAGAAAAVAIAITAFGVTAPAGYLVFAVAGAAVAGAAVLVLGGARRGMDPIRLVLAGAATSVVLGALMHIIVVNADEHLFDRYRNWMIGSLQGRDLDVLVPAGLLVAAGLVIAVILARSLDAAALGPDVARALGVRPGLLWTAAGLGIVLLAGGATAAAGPVAFIGLTAPHVARALVGSGHRRMLPAAALIAALFLLVADVLGRVVALPGEVGVGIMAAILGGPFFIALVRRRKLVLG